MSYRQVHPTPTRPRPVPHDGSCGTRHDPPCGDLSWRPYLVAETLRNHDTLCERHYQRLRETGLAMFPDGAWLLVEGDTVRLNRTVAEAFSVALAQTPDPALAARARRTREDQR